MATVMYAKELRDTAIKVNSPAPPAQRRRG
jgi:hypothetical protein